VCLRANPATSWEIGLVVAVWHGRCFETAPEGKPMTTTTSARPLVAIFVSIAPAAICGCMLEAADPADFERETEDLSVEEVEVYECRECGETAGDEGPTDYPAAAVIDASAAFDVESAREPAAPERADVERNAAASLIWPADERACDASDDCGEGELCLGTERCGGMTCQTRESCSADFALYCGCDGEVFQASTTCASRPFLHRGFCTPDDREP
jgi:hypothetical protein